MPGRGTSDWLADPNDYAFPTYLATLAALIARSGAETVDWVGTSMGALLGIVLAAQPKSPLRRLVVNDAGPLIEPAALARIREYVGRDPVFATYADADAYIRAVSAPFGRLDDAQWDHLTRTTVREQDDGSWRLRYDPGIAIPFRNAAAPTDLWLIWDAIRCPTLVLRGADSDLLSAEHCATDGGARPASASAGVRGRRACAHAARPRAVRAGRGVPAGGISARRARANAGPVKRGRRG